MQRKIIFRGTDIRTGKIVKGSLINLFLHGVMGNIIVTNPNISGEHLSNSCALCFDKDDVSVVYPNSVGQYTGLHDKNGNSIFKGDIVKWDDGSNGRYWRFAVVTIAPDIIFDCEPVKVVDGVRNSSDKAFRFADFIYKDTENHLTVVGNVFDNPEIVAPYHEIRVGTVCPFSNDPNIHAGSPFCSDCEFRTKLASSPRTIKDSSLKIACKHI